MAGDSSAILRAILWQKSWSLRPVEGTWISRYTTASFNATNDARSAQGVRKGALSLQLCREISMTTTEHVLVIPTPHFHSLGYFQGFSSEVDRYLDKLLDPSQTRYLPRPDMEKDPTFKQLIPYVIFRYRDPAGRVSVFQYTRGKGQGEARLHAKRSIGIGGHISSDDAGCHDVYQVGMRRELDEEVNIDTPYRSSLVGLINDDLTEVGKVHLGVVHIFDVDAPQVHPREDEICNAGFRPVTELLAEIEQFETWSQITLKALFSESV